MEQSSGSPRVSVIMPAFNAAPYVARAISSILDQSYSDFELLVVDDGSADSTPDVVSNFTDQRLRFLSNEKNLGLVASLTRGLEMARGELIARMDADDESLPQRIERLVSLIDSDPGLGVVSCAYQDFDENHDNLGVTILPSTDMGIRRDLYCKTHVFCHAGSLMRRQALDDVGGYRPKWFPVEDRDLWLRMLTRWRGANSNEVYYRVRKHAHSVVATLAEHQAQLVLQSTIDALRNPTSPVDMSPQEQHAGWARGALFAAFGLAMNGDQKGTVYFLRQAVDWEEVVADEGFEELLLDRISTYLHHHARDISGVSEGIERVLKALPAPLAGKKSVKTTVLAKAHAIAAFQADNAGDIWSARKEAWAGLSKSRAMWSNRGLLKLALGIDTNHATSRS
jgi:hypothetical protein